jgi:hypothetical protein
VVPPSSERCPVPSGRLCPEVSLQVSPREGCPEPRLPVLAESGALVQPRSPLAYYGLSADGEQPASLSRSGPGVLSSASGSATQSVDMLDRLAVYYLEGGRPRDKQKPTHDRRK